MAHIVAMCPRLCLPPPVAYNEVYSNGNHGEGTCSLGPHLALKPDRRIRGACCFLISQPTCRDLVLYRERMNSSVSKAENDNSTLGQCSCFRNGRSETCRLVEAETR